MARSWPSRSPGRLRPRAENTSSFQSAEARGCLVVVRWSRLPQKARVLLVVCGGAGLLAEGLYFRATATRVEGTAIDRERRGRPVVVYWRGEQWLRYKEPGPSERLAVG